MSRLPILHFSDAYRVSEQKLPNDAGVVDVTQFSFMVKEIRSRWPAKDDGKREGLVLFSGDLFSPSIESGVTRGSHMVPVINEISPDVSVIGNHDFDFGYPHLTTLLADVNHPWIISNILDTKTGGVPTPFYEFYVTERCGVRIGIIGLIEEDWIATIAAWPTDFVYMDVKDTTVALSKRLRDPEGEFACELIIALTHARVPNDIRFAEAVNALSPSAQSDSFANTQGADLLLGGHDHFYYVSKGFTSWDNYDLNKEVPGAEEDKGTVLVAKSGTDFRDLSEIILDLEDTPEGSVRRKIIKAIRGKRLRTKPNSPSSQKLKDILRGVLDKVSKGLKAPLCRTLVPLDLRSQLIRMGESASGNWFADVFRHAYDDALCRQGYNTVDGVFIGAGGLRGDSVYGPGTITVGDFMEILPYADPVVVIEIDGITLWEAFEAGLSKYPAQEGRFPVISGFQVTWDSRKSPGHRVLSIARRVQEPVEGYGNGSSDRQIVYEEIKREEGSRKYSIMIGAYMAAGHDGYDCLKGSKYLIDDEGGQIMSTLVRSYLLGAQYIKHVQNLSDDNSEYLHGDTANNGAEAFVASSATGNRYEGQHFDGVQGSPTHMSPFTAANHEDMSAVDFFDGNSLRKSDGDDEGDDEMAACSVQESIPTIDDTKLVVISPALDGRLRDISRESL